MTADIQPIVRPIAGVQAAAITSNLLSPASAKNDNISAQSDGAARPFIGWARFP
jgi:hypothetical protein